MKEISPQAKLSILLFPMCFLGAIVTTIYSVFLMLTIDSLSFRSSTKVHAFLIKFILIAPTKFKSSS